MHQGISPRAMQINTLLTSIQPIVTEPDYMKMKSKIRITNVDMNSRETIVQVSLTSLIQIMVLTLILMFWRTLQKQQGEVIQKCEVLSRLTQSTIVSPPSKINSPN